MFLQELVSCGTDRNKIIQKIKDYIYLSSLSVVIISCLHICAVGHSISYQFNQRFQFEMARSHLDVLISPGQISIQTHATRSSSVLASSEGIRTDFPGFCSASESVPKSYTQICWNCILRVIVSPRSMMHYSALFERIQTVSLITCSAIESDLQSPNGRPRDLALDNIPPIFHSLLTVLMIPLSRSR